MFDDEQDDFFGSDFQQSFNNDSADDFFFVVEDKNTNESSDENFEDNTLDSSFDGSSDNNSFYSTEETNTKVPKLRYKSVGILLAVVLVFLAVIVMGISNINVKKKSNSSSYNNTQNNVANNNTVTETQAPTQVQNQGSVTSSDNLVALGNDVKIDYSSSNLFATGVISNMTRYLRGNQVVYCIDINMTIGGSSTVIYYYCGYNVYSQLKIGDIVTVEYQQVSDKCFTVCTIKK